jgi:hypothetical protein
LTFNPDISNHDFSQQRRDEDPSIWTPWTAQVGPEEGRHRSPQKIRSSNLQTVDQLLASSTGPVEHWPFSNMPVVSIDGRILGGGVVGRPRHHELHPLPVCPGALVSSQPPSAATNRLITYVFEDPTATRPSCRAP